MRGGPLAERRRLFRLPGSFFKRFDRQLEKMSCQGVVNYV
jgi:hypothetical protein